MNPTNTLHIIRQVFERILPSQDGRTPNSPFEFVVAFIFNFLGDTKKPSLEELRRGIMSHLSKPISRSSFWERLSRKRLFFFLEQILSELMKQLTVPLFSKEQILNQLGVCAIYIIDSTTITLPAWAAKYFRGTGSAAAIKWHTCIDVMQGTLCWNQITSGRTHDRKCFPDIIGLVGRLVILDLGYWDYSLLQAIEVAGGFYLSRVRSDAVIIIKEIVQGLGKRSIGKPLLSILMRRKRGSIIELYGEHRGKESILRLRVIGFWNPIEHRYHWYVTNLKIAAMVIYCLYRLRWQIELMFKGCKQSLRLDEITSGNKNIIKSLLLGVVVAQLCSQTILRNSLSQLSEEKRFSVSYQRISKVFVNLSQRVISFLLDNCEASLGRLIESINIFTGELFDPNYRRRKSSLAQIKDALNA